MTLKFTSAVCLLYASLSCCTGVFAETMKAVDVVAATNTDWLALARAERAIRAGETVEFVLPTYPATSFAEVRRALWLAGLYGIVNQSSPDKQTFRLMQDELVQLRKRLKTPFSFDVAVRDSSSIDTLLPQLINAQVACLLIGEKEKSEIPTILRCQNDEVLNESSGVAFTSLPLSVTLIQACQSELGLVFERDGSVATNVFVRRFNDGTATIVNLENTTRRNLLYRRDLGRIPFDLLPADVVHIAFREPPRLTNACGELFSAGLWQVTFEDKNLRPRLIQPDRLLTVVNENYMGPVRYRTTVCVPGGGSALFLHLETHGAATEVSIGGIPLGTRAWEPFEWPVPPECRGKNALLEICIEKRTFTGFLQGIPTWNNR